MKLHSTLTGAVQKFSKDFTTRAEERDQEDRSVLKARATAYRQVDKRDGDTCRGCFVRMKLGGRTGIRPEHHHLRGRGGIEHEVTSNIARICRWCHTKIHVKRTMTIQGNADQALRVNDDGTKYVSLPPGKVIRGIAS